MIRIIDARNRAAHTPALQSMFEDRKRLFVDLLRWDVPVIDDRYEIDAFDTSDAIYVIALDASGAHRGSLRLLPTTRAHILDTLFPSLCADCLPCGEHVCEITRLCLPQRFVADERLEIRNALITAMVEHALSTGITRLTGVVKEAFRKDILAMGWLCEPLGPARRIGGARLGAFALHIASDTPARLGWTGIWSAGDDDACQASAVA